MNIRLFIFVLVIFTGLFSQAQECEYTPSKSIQKTLSKITDPKGKLKSEEKMVLLEKALAEDENCLPCMFHLASLEFTVAMRSQRPSFTRAIELSEKVVAQCENYHSKLYYILGGGYYIEQEYEKALVAFEKFMNFPEDDPSKFDKNYDAKYQEAKESLVNIKLYNDIFNGNKGFEFKPKKVEGVCTAADEYLPMISPDGEIMFYTRTRSAQSMGDLTATLIEEFFWSRRKDINAIFDNGEALPKPFNVKGFGYGGATVSVDNKELIIARTNPNKLNPRNVDLFRSKFERVALGNGKYEYKWSDWEDLGMNINTPDGWEAQPTLSGDGQTLIFVSVRPTCMKDDSGNYSHDLFLSKKKQDGSWGPCIRVPETVNTSGQEKSPFIHSDSHSLYFASDGHPGVGGMDLFKVEMNEDGTFSTPQNLGVPINTKENQVGIIVSSDGELAYYGSEALVGPKNLDVFEFQLPVRLRPERVAIIKGEVKEDNGSPVSNATVTINYAQSGKEDVIKINEDDGSYAAVVRTSKNEDVVLKVEGENIAFNAQVIAKKDDPNPADVLKLNVEAAVVAENKPFVIKDIYYTTARADINPESMFILSEFADYLKEHPSWVIEIRGHTDNTGEDKTNEILSLNRAKEVMAFLVGKGVQENQLVAVGYGEKKPIATNDTEAGRAKNRRTEFVIKKM